MAKQLTFTPHFTATATLLAGVVLTLAISHYFYTSGKSQWQQQAHADMERISELVVSQVQHAYAPMLGLAMLMQGSQEVTQAEFEQALEINEQNDPNVKRTAYAFVSNTDSSPEVQLSSNSRAPVLPAQNTSQHSALMATLKRVSRAQSIVTSGPVFQDNNELHKVFFVTAAHSQSARGYLLALVDIDSLIHELNTKIVPRGLHCQLKTLEANIDPRADNYATAANALQHTIDITLGGQPWQLVWRLTHDYQGGHAKHLSIAVIIAGVLVSLLTSSLAYLWLTHKHRAKQLDQAYQALQAATKQMIKSEKMASLGSLVAGIAHEMNTPIGNSLTVATALRERAREFSQSVHAGALKKSVLSEFLSSLEEATELLERNTRRAAQLVGNFKQVAVDQSSERRRTFDLRQTINETLWTLEPTLKHTHHTITIDIPDKIPCDSYPGAIGQIITNLVANSVQHGFEGKDDGKIDISASYHQGDICLHYRDDGCGIEEDHLKKVFDPFFTTKLGQGGSGLGLHIIYNLVTGLLGGDVSIASPVGHGVHFTLHFPASAPAKHDTRIVNGQ